MAGRFPIEINHLDTDLRLEVIGNELLEKGISVDQILVSPLGEFFRGFSRDVVELNLVEDGLGNPVYYQIKTSRNGIYDGLPQNIFHDIQDDILDENDPDSVELVKRNRKEEEAARRFFQIVEKEMYRLLLFFEKEERKTIIGTSEFSQHEIFLRLWSELRGLESKYIIPLMQILPLVTKYQSDLDQVERFLQFLLGVPVQIVVDTEPRVYDLPANYSTLGDLYLGGEIVLNGKITDYDPTFILKIGPLEASLLEEFMPGMPASQALDVFSQYYFPIQSNVLIQFILVEKSRTVLLRSEKATQGQNPIKARLGISAFL